MHPKPKSAPPAPATLPPLPAHLQASVDAAVIKGVEAALAARPNNPQGPIVTNVRDLQLDLTKDSRQAHLNAALGLKMKQAYLKQAKHFGRGNDEAFQKLDAFLTRVKAAGQFAGIFESGGAFTRETVTSEIVELARPNSILLGAGIRTISGYGARLTMGTIDEGVKVYWVAEGEPGTPSTVKDGSLVLTAHKLMALARISNDLLRLSAIDAAAIIGGDMAAAIGLEIDITGFKGKGPKRPNGIRHQMEQAARTASAGTTAANKVADTDGAMGSVAKAQIPGGLKANKGFYYSSTDTFLALRQTRDSAGWLFPDLRSGENPTLNGFPFHYSETLADDGVLGFGLANQLILGEAMPLETAMGENGTDFSADMVTMRGITEVDFLLRYRKAFAEKTGVAY
ncbi:phage major capsid protein [Corallococcus sp. ZKHCc1 1396]|uniref:Phage major capsid protein n=2 Tax=Corallococcus soli TaxID=2710757 RepID=A0ABR9PIM9_9BACT|nr:phage major capsid protein [Corallococcus soli]MBE4747757.1 phage major capsid protein [Corallococcus soli]